VANDFPVLVGYKRQPIRRGDGRAQSVEKVDDGPAMIPEGRKVQLADREMVLWSFLSHVHDRHARGCEAARSRRFAAAGRSWICR